MANKVNYKFKYHLFISYCHKNKQIVHKVAEKLQQKYEIWIDLNFNNGNLYREIANGIDESQIFVCFVSKEYCESETCCKEIQLAYDSKKIIMPIMLEREEKMELNYLLEGWFC
jgi:hypothetical protein